VVALRETVLLGVLVAVNTACAALQQPTVSTSPHAPTSDPNPLLENQITPPPGEKVWRMPMEANYFDQLKSSCADMKNTGGR
jgi:hypothetical protein